MQYDTHNATPATPAFPSSCIYSCYSCLPLLPDLLHTTHAHPSFWVYSLLLMPLLLDLLLTTPLTPSPPFIVWSCIYSPRPPPLPAPVHSFLVWPIYVSHCSSVLTPLCDSIPTPVAPTCPLSYDILSSAIYYSSLYNYISMYYIMWLKYWMECGNLIDNTFVTL